MKTKLHLLEEILSHFGKPLKKEYYSAGATITREGLKEIHRSIAPETFGSAETKSEHIIGMMDALGIEFSESHLSAGGTISRRSLELIHKKIRH